MSVAATLMFSRTHLLLRRCHVRGRKKVLHSEEPWANNHHCVNLIYDQRISNGCILYMCIGHRVMPAGVCGPYFLILDRHFARIVHILLSQQRDRRTTSHCLDAIVGSVQYVPFSSILTCPKAEHWAEHEKVMSHEGTLCSI